VKENGTMPTHFGRFRLLNTDGPDPLSIVNNGDSTIYVRASEEDPQTEVPPGQEVEVPTSGGEAIIEAVGSGCWCTTT
jgi:hypothetical protein